jgi:hypothetical protein
LFPSHDQRGVQAFGGLGGLFGFGAGVAAPMIFDALTGTTKKLRVTRKLKSDTKRAVELLGIEVVAERMQIGIEGVMYILNRKMRNDGPMVTKAALRKTRTTIRKMKGVCDLYDPYDQPRSVGLLLVELPQLEQQKLYKLHNRRTRLCH